MSGLYIERRQLSGAASLSWDMAHHLYARALQGEVVVTCESPSTLRASVRKQWVKLLRRVQRERSSTLDAARIQELTNELNYLQQLHFIADAPGECPTVEVYFATLEALHEVPPNCQTLYVTQPVGSETLEILTQNMPRHALVVLY